MCGHATSFNIYQACRNHTMEQGPGLRTGPHIYTLSHMSTTVSIKIIDTRELDIGITVICIYSYII